jgi:hypothetical protein
MNLPLILSRSKDGSGGHDVKDLSPVGMDEIGGHGGGSDFGPFGNDLKEGIGLLFGRQHVAQFIEAGNKSLRIKIDQIIEVLRFARFGPVSFGCHAFSLCPSLQKKDMGHATCEVYPCPYVERILHIGSESWRPSGVATIGFYFPWATALKTSQVFRSSRALSS